MAIRRLLGRIRALPANELVGGVLLISVWLLWLSDAIRLLGRRRTYDVPGDVRPSSGGFIVGSTRAGPRYATWTYVRAILVSTSGSAFMLLIAAALLSLSRPVRLRRAALLSGCFVLFLGIPFAVHSGAQNSSSFLVAGELNVAANAIMAFAAIWILRRRSVRTEVGPHDVAAV